MVRDQFSGVTLRHSNDINRRRAFLVILFKFRSVSGIVFIKQLRAFVNIQRSVVIKSDHFVIIRKCLTPHNRGNLIPTLFNALTLNPELTDLIGTRNSQIILCR